MGWRTGLSEFQSLVYNIHNTLQPITKTTFHMGLKSKHQGVELVAHYGPTRCHCGLGAHHHAVSQLVQGRVVANKLEAH
jgi:hypothetical protein